MIINYFVPFANYRKIARTYCKIVRSLSRPFISRRFLTNLCAENIEYQDIPVIINNYNRIICLRKLIAWLEKAGMRNIYIIDNNSCYPELLNYYQTTKHTVIRLNANIGYKSVWDTNIHLWFTGLPYVYTDPDILPIEECPLDAVGYFQQLLKEHQAYTKVGFSLKIDDIPDFYPQKEQVISWESKFWKKPIKKELYEADIDTTFALYRSGTRNQQWGKTLRTAGEYMARHLPWYENPATLSDEEIYYRNKTIGSSWYQEAMKN